MGKPSRKMQQTESPEFGLCRGFNHEFPPPRSAADVRWAIHGDLGYIIEVDQHCINCGATRKRFLDPDTGIRVGGTYIYPKGYLRVGLGHITVYEQAEYRFGYLRGLVGARRLRRLRVVK